MKLLPLGCTRPERVFLSRGAPNGRYVRVPARTYGVNEYILNDDALLYLDGRRCMARSDIQGVYDLWIRQGED